MSQPVVPPQAAPFPQEGRPDLVNRLWYLFFHGLARALEVNSELTAEQSDPAFNLTVAYVDIPGMSITLNQAGVWLITANVEFNIASNDAVAARLMANGVEQPRFIVSSSPSGAGSNLTAMAAQTWIYTAAAAGEVVTLQAEILNNITGGDQTAQDGTNLTAVFLHS